TPDAGGLIPAHYYDCQRHEPLTRVRIYNTQQTYFDLFAAPLGGVIPVGMCITYQQWEQHYDEMCACAYRDNCATPSRWPATSGLQ
ncbi:hypothetical protein PENTCL1PPCAC_24637, partial [Pristionchus entomophagus]